MNITLVGYGHLGKWHAEKLSRVYGKNFIAIVELDTKKHEEIKAKFPDVLTFCNLDDIINDTDAVIIATPTTYHFKLIEKALINGKHCFVEKPMTANLAESVQVGNLLEGSNLHFQVGHSERFHGFWMELMSTENFNDVKLLVLIG